MNENKKFDGIILPSFWGMTNRLENKTLGHVMGISSRELAIGPKEIKINYALLKDKKMKDFNLFWLENCPNDNGPYSMKGCYASLLPHFSKIGDTEKTSIRVRPAENSNPKFLDYDVIFWKDGKALPIGQQYSYASYFLRNHPDFDLLNVVKEWESENYDSKLKMSIGEIKNNLNSVFGDIPAMKLMDTMHEIKIAERDAGWSNRFALIRETI